MAKRKQVKNACGTLLPIRCNFYNYNCYDLWIVNCQKACKKCDDGRPCTRCVKYGIEDTCINSSRKERKKGVKRGTYRAVSSKSSSELGEEENWNPGNELPRERSARPRKLVNYKEFKDEFSGVSEEEDDDEDEDDDDVEGEDDEGKEKEDEGNQYGGEYDGNKHVKRTGTEMSTSNSSVLKEIHQPLFKMVLDLMHGDATMTADQPKLFDLAVICSEILELERKEAQVQLKARLEQERSEANRTPIPPIFVRRDVPSPPNTPVNLKGHHNSSAPFIHHQFIMTTPSNYYTNHPPYGYGHF